MLIKEIDYLSPKITFYYSNYLTHKSVLSGILSILNYLLLLLLVVYYLVLVFIRKNPEAFYYRSYIEDPGIIDIDSYNFFHYLTFRSDSIYDPKAMSVIGVEMRPSEAVMMEDETLYDHWHYTLCNLREIMPKDLHYLIKDETGLCVTEFFNSTNQKVYKLKEKGYVHPTIRHGTGNDNSFPYGILFRYCHSKERECYDKNTMKEKYSYLNSYVLNILDKYVDIHNYTNAFVNYFSTFEIGIVHTAITLTNSHFNPVFVKTDSGLLYEKMKLTKGYALDQVVRSSYDYSDKGTHAMMFFWMHNQIEYYQRVYLKIVDILVTVSGIFKFTSSIFFSANFLVNKYVSINDFGKFLDKAYFKIKSKQSFNSIKFKPPTPNESKSILKHTNSIGKSVVGKTINDGKIYYKSKVTLAKIFKFYAKVGNNFYISNLISLRKKIISEERMIKNFLKVKQFAQLYLKDPIKKTKTLNIVKKLCEGEVVDGRGKHCPKNSSGVELLHMSDKKIVIAATNNDQVV